MKEIFEFFLVDQLRLQLMIYRFIYILKEFLEQNYKSYKRFSVQKLEMYKKLKIWTKLKYWRLDMLYYNNVSWTKGVRVLPNFYNLIL